MTMTRGQVIKRSLGFIFLILFLVLMSVVALLSTHRGTQFLFERVLSQQDTLQYQYVKGTLWQGIHLNDVHLMLDQTEIKADEVQLGLGWRAILAKEAHFHQSHIRHLHIINHAPADDKPFQYPELKLPLTLRFNQLQVDQLTIQTLASKTELHRIQLNDAVWKDTTLSFKKSQLDLFDIYLSEATGNIDFTANYPLRLETALRIPVVEEQLNMQQMYAVAEGSLAEVRLGVATKTPDLLTGWAIIHPMDNDVPMRGQLQFNQYQLPILPEEHVFIEQGTLDFSGNSHGIALELETDLATKQFAKARYTGKMYTDFVNRLTIDHLVSDVFQGHIQVRESVLDWSNTEHLSWQMNAIFDDLNFPETLLSPEVVAFLPKHKTGQLNSTGTWGESLKTQNQLNWSNQEQWTIDYQALAQQTPQVHVKWQNIHRELPYIVGLNSPQGEAKIQLTASPQIDFSAQVKPYPDSVLIEGAYQGRVIVEPQQVVIPSIQYQHGQAQMKGDAKVLLETSQRPMSWLANVDLTHFNPQWIQPSVPLTQIDGRVLAQGTMRKQTHIIQLNQVDLHAKLAEQTGISSSPLHLTGNSVIALMFHTPEKGGEFKSFAVNYEGEIDALQHAKGILKLDMAGTPDYLTFNQLYHDGVAGKLDLTGHVDLSQGLAWNVKSNLLHFKPEYVYAGASGDISGIIHSSGEWSDRHKQIQVQQLNIAGHLNGQPLRGEGQLSLNLNPSDTLLDTIKQFKTQALHVSYANNHVQIEADDQHVLLKVDARHLDRILEGLQGRVFGEVLFKAQEQQAYSHLVIENLNYQQLVKMDRLTLKGELPISETRPTELNLSIEELTAFDRVLKQAQATLQGTYRTHVLNISSQFPRSTFTTQIAGGFNHEGDWSGQMKHGHYQSPRMQLSHQDAIMLHFDRQQQQITLSEHCWNNKQNALCFDRPIIIGANQAQLSLVSQDIYIQDLAEFLPEGMEMSGLLNGFVKVNWKKGQVPDVNAQILAKNGTIGVLAEHEFEESSTLAYDELSTTIHRVPDGIRLYSQIKTPDIGTGFIHLIAKPEEEGIPIRGEVAFDDVRLQLLKPFISDVRTLSGRLSVAGKINGFLTAPEFMGEAEVQDGVFSMVSLPVDLHNIQLYSKIRQNTAEIQGHFNSGKGVATLNGLAGWGQLPFIRLKLKGENLLVRQAPQIVANVNPDLAIEILPTQQQLSVDGTILVPKALITMPESRAVAVEVSPDVRIIRENQQLEALQKAQAWNIRTDIDLTLGNQIIFQGFDARIPMAGKLKLLQNGTELSMRAKGAIGITKKVPISAYGQTVDLSRAIARFDGLLLNPSLDIDATKTVQGTHMGVRVLGTALNPNIQIYNDAGLSEQETLNALLTGRLSDGGSNTSTDSFRSDVNNAVAAAGLSMGLGGTRALTNQIGRAFGLNGLALDAQGNGDDTQISLTGYITPDLYIRYGIGVFTPVNKLTLRYQLNRRLYLEASQDLERAIDLFYNWRF